MPDFNSEQRKKLAYQDKAMPDGSYPIRNISDLKNAIQSYGRSKNKEATKRWIKKRAKELDAENLLPESWTNEESDELAHHGIKGMKWGIRRAKAQLGYKTSGLKSKKSSSNSTKKEQTSNKKSSSKSRKFTKEDISRKFNKGKDFIKNNKKQLAIGGVSVALSAAGLGYLNYIFRPIANQTVPTNRLGVLKNQVGVSETANRYESEANQNRKTGEPDFIENFDIAGNYKNANESYNIKAQELYNIASSLKDED